MEATGYRSYVVRVWSRGRDGEQATRVAIEEVQSGRKVELRGERAAAVSARISAALASDSGDPERVAHDGHATTDREPTHEEDKRMILVVGATGNLGGQIARGLVEQGRDVRILVRPESPYRPLVDLGCRAVIGDLKDPGSLERACQGVDTIVTTAISVTRLPPDTIETVELGGYASLIDAARSAGVRHFVYTSALLADSSSPIPFAAAKAVTAERLMASGITWTVVAPDAFMDVWLAMIVAGPAFEGREVVYVGGGDRVHQFVHSRDVAAIAIACVDCPRVANRVIPLGGPAAISIREAVATFEGVLDRSIPHRGVALGEPVPGFPPSIVGMLASFDQFDSRLDMAELSAEFGVELTSVQAWARSMVPVAAR